MTSALSYAVWALLGLALVGDTVSAVSGEPYRDYVQTHILVPLGFILDFFFAQWFFVYPNLGATLGIPAPALGRSVPVEEYIFYLTGAMASGISASGVAR